MQALTRRVAVAPSRPRPDRPIPVALAITELDLGGAERALAALATGLDRRRWRPTVVALGPEGELAAPIRAAGIEVRCLDVDPRRPGRAILRLASALRAIAPALVQSFLFHANLAARLASPFAGRPWVVGGLRVAERQRLWHLTIDRRTNRLATGSVCVSAGVERFARKIVKLPADRLCVIPNGVDPAPFDRAIPTARASLGVPESAPLALFVGRLDPQKGLAILLDAAEIVSRMRPDWHLALVGSGPEGGALRARTNAHPALSDRVHWLGRRDDVPGLLKTADLLVLPSLWEGMPNVVLEAMAAGRAVVGTEVEGTEDLVIPGRNGWLVPTGDAKALAVALLDAASDPGRLARFGASGRARVEAEFTPGRVVEAYDRLWSRILGYEGGR